MQVHIMICQDFSYRNTKILVTVTPHSLPILRLTHGKHTNPSVVRCMHAQGRMDLFHEP